MRLSPGGGISVEPAEGREDVDFVGRAALDGSGDVVVVPTDMLDAIRSGDEDPRRYNVSRLLADGHTDAAKVEESELDTRDYDGFVPAAEQVEASQAAQELSVSILDRSGGVPEASAVSWMQEGTDESGDIAIGEDGTGTAELEPGDYLIMTLTFNAANDTERGEAVYGFTPVTVGEEPTELVVDAAAAAPVSVEVEREDAELEEHLLYMEVGNAAAFEFLDAETDAYLLPRPEASGFAFNFIYQPRLTGPADAAEPYDYTLAFAEAGSLPADPAYAVTDAELAIQQTEFQDLGAEVEGYQCDHPRGWEEQSFFFGQCEKRTFPSKATTLYNAAPIRWDRSIDAGLYDADGNLTDGYTSWESEVELPVGPSERVIGDGPVSAGIPYAYRMGDTILGFLSPAAIHSGETLNLVGYETSAVTLSRDGEELGSAENPAEFTFELPEGDQGRYTLAVEATRGTATSLFGVESSLEWQFDSATVEEASAGPAGGHLGIRSRAERLGRTRPAAGDHRGARLAGAHRRADRPGGLLRRRRNLDRSRTRRRHRHPRTPRGRRVRLAPPDRHRQRRNRGHPHDPPLLRPPLTGRQPAPVTDVTGAGCVQRNGVAPVEGRQTMKTLCSCCSTKARLTSASSVKGSRPRSAASLKKPSPGRPVPSSRTRTEIMRCSPVALECWTVMSSQSLPTRPGISAPLKGRPSSRCRSS